jgi:HAD superfamily hydrolase (TIGR01544 family)
METWQTVSSDVMLKVPFSQAELKKATEDSALMLRHGVDSFFSLCKEQSIPVNIVSAGIKNLIDVCLESVPAAHIARVVANVVEFDAQGISSHFCKPLIHSLSKSSVLQGQQLKKNVMLLGDMPHDLLMVDHHRQDKVLSIGFFNDAERYNIEDYRNKFDVLCLKDGNFEVAELITAWICGVDRPTDESPSLHHLSAYKFEIVSS